MVCRIMFFFSLFGLLHTHRDTAVSRPPTCLPAVRPRLLAACSTDRTPAGLMCQLHLPSSLLYSIVLDRPHACTRASPGVLAVPPLPTHLPNRADRARD